MTERNNKKHKFLDKYLGIPLTLPVSLFRRFDRKKVERENIKTIGIICFGAIGDVLLLSGLISGLKKELPDVAISLILSETNKMVGQLLQDVDHVRSFPIKKINSLINYLRCEKFDVLIDSSQWARVGAIISGLSGAGVTIGFKTKQQYRSLPYDVRVEHSNHCHEMDNFLNLGKSVIPNLYCFPQIKVNDLSNKVKEYKHYSPFVICHMWAAGSNIELKQWDKKKWAVLAKKLIEMGFFVIWSGSKSDKEKTDDFMSTLFTDNEQSKMTSVAGLLSLIEISELLSFSTACISVNTGIMHLSALVGCRTIAIHGATNPKRWGPIGNNIGIISPQNIKQFLNLGFEKIDDINSYAYPISVDSVLEQFVSLQKSQAN